MRDGGGKMVQRDAGCVNIQHTVQQMRCQMKICDRHKKSHSPFLSPQTCYLQRATNLPRTNTITKSPTTTMFNAPAAATTRQQTASQLHQQGNKQPAN
eukprot:scaffold195389_cov70-Cyclotella_meneghiniana.AAC.1